MKRTAIILLIFLASASVSVRGADAPPNPTTLPAATASPGPAPAPKTAPPPPPAPAPVASPSANRAPLPKPAPVVPAATVQMVSGARIATAAEEYVRQNLPAGPLDTVQCSASLPPQRVPAGAVQLTASWNGPPASGSGRVIVPVRILVDGRKATEVAVLVQIGHIVEMSARPGVKRGEAVTLQVENANGALRLSVPATALQAGAVGEQIKVMVADTGRTLSVLIIGPHQTSLEP